MTPETITKIKEAGLKLDVTKWIPRFMQQTTVYSKLL